MTRRRRQNGTSYEVFGDFPVAPWRGQDRHRAANARNPDQSWYMVLAPCPNPHIVTAVTDGAEGATELNRQHRLRCGYSKTYFDKQSSEYRRTKRREPRLMYAARARRAASEPFCVRPGIAERLGLPYMDADLGVRGHRPGRVRHVHARAGDRRMTSPAAPGISPIASRSTRCSAWLGMYTLPESTTRASASSGLASTRSSA